MPHNASEQLPSGKTLIHLPVANKAPDSVGFDAPLRLVPPPDSSESALDQQPFHPLKILNHFERLKAVAEGRNVAPITVEIDPSNKCNHQCEWCVSMLAHTGEYLKFELIESLINELRSMDVRSVVLKGGGEPTVHPQFPNILKQIDGNGLAIGLITNGSIPRAESREAIAKHVEWIRVSLDAARAETHEKIHGSKDFDRIISNVTWLKEHATSTLIGLNFVAEPRNVDEMVSFTQMALDLGVDYISIRCVFDPKSPLPTDIRTKMLDQGRQVKAMETESFKVMLGNLNEDYVNATEKPFEFDQCLGPNLIGVVGAEGEVYACCFLRGNKEFSFGNINKDSFNDIWNGSKRQHVMDRVYRGECGRVCQGGMTHNRYNMYNQILNYLAKESKAHVDFA